MSLFSNWVVSYLPMRCLSVPLFCVSEFENVRTGDPALGPGVNVGLMRLGGAGAQRYATSLTRKQLTPVSVGVAGNGHLEYLSRQAGVQEFSL